MTWFDQDCLPMDYFNAVNLEVISCTVNRKFIYKYIKHYLTLFVLFNKHYLVFTYY